MCSHLGKLRNPDPERNWVFSYHTHWVHFVYEVPFPLFARFRDSYKVRNPKIEGLDSFHVSTDGQKRAKAFLIYQLFTFGDSFRFSCFRNWSSEISIWKTSDSDSMRNFLPRTGSKGLETKFLVQKSKCCLLSRK